MRVNFVKMITPTSSPHGNRATSFFLREANSEAARPNEANNQSPIRVRPSLFIALRALSSLHRATVSFGEARRFSSRTAHGHGAGRQTRNVILLSADLDGHSSHLNRALRNLHGNLQRVHKIG